MGSIEDRASGQQTAINLRELRDRKEPDPEGNLIPETVVNGRAYWREHGSTGLIGRAEIYSPSGGIASSYSCPPPCCIKMYVNMRIEPETLYGVYNQTDLVRAKTDFYFGCDLFPVDTDVTRRVRWSTDDDSKVDFTEYGVFGQGVKYVGVGTTKIRATFFPEECNGGDCPYYGCGPGRNPGCSCARTRVDDEADVSIIPLLGITTPEDTVPLGTLNTRYLAAAGYPSGGYYTWQTSSPKVTLLTNSAPNDYYVTVRAEQRSVYLRDVQINVSYTVNGVTAGPYPVYFTVQDPLHLLLVGTERNGPASSCATGRAGWERLVVWEVRDHLIPSNPVRYEGMVVSDVGGIRILADTCGDVTPAEAAYATDGSGTFPDNYYLCSAGCVSGSCLVTADQYWLLNGRSIANPVRLEYSCSGITLNGL